MNSLENIQNQGFSVIENVYSKEEIAQMIAIIESQNIQKSTFLRSTDLFAIRQFLKEIPALFPLIFNANLQAIIKNLCGKDYFMVKSIYFDKPETSNWFVAYHQDLTISVDNKRELPEFINWTVKQNQFAVQAPLSILEKNITIRIHLDDTCAENGALSVIPSSHLKGIFPVKELNLETEERQVCEVPKGGIMLMKPLLFHASHRTKNHQRRRVIHLELSNQILPEGMNWSEKMEIPFALEGLN